MSNGASKPRGPSRAWLFVPGFVLVFTVLSLGWPWIGSYLEVPSLSAYWETFTEWGRRHLGVIRPDSTALFIMAPAILVAAWAGTMLLLFDKPPDWLRLPVGLAFLVLQLIEGGTERADHCGWHRSPSVCHSWC